MGGFNQLNVNNNFPVKSSKLEPCNGRKAIALNISLSGNGPASVIFQYADNFGSLQGMFIQQPENSSGIIVVIVATGQIISLTEANCGYVPILGVDSSEIQVFNVSGSDNVEYNLFLLNYTPDPIIWNAVYISSE